MGNVFDIGSKQAIKANGHLILSDEVLERLVSCIDDLSPFGYICLFVDPETSDLYQFLKSGDAEKLFDKDENGRFETSAVTPTYFEWDLVQFLGKVNVKLLEDASEYVRETNKKNGGNNE